MTATEGPLVPGDATVGQRGEAAGGPEAAGPRMVLQPVRRKHVLVRLIEERLAAPGSHIVDNPRLAHLPEMLLRHGVLQTAAFLMSKSRDGNGKSKDGHLLDLLEACLKKVSVKEAMGDLQAKGALAALASLPVEQYLMVNEAAIEAATWIALLAEARVRLAAPAEQGP